MTTKLIKTNQDKCVACNKCIMVCPVKFANDIEIIDNKRKITVNPDRCIGCGACMQVCDQKARVYFDDFDRFLYDLKNGKKINILVAPAVMAIKYNNYKKIFSWLKQMGANLIFDASFGADITSWGYIKYFNDKKNEDYVISQPCPAIVEYIEKYQPELISHLIPIQSPVCCSAIYLKKYLNIKDDIALISPCIAKKKEIEREQNKGLIEYNITINNLFDFLTNSNINLDELQETDFDFQQGGLGRLFSKTGGLKENLHYHSKNLKIKEVSSTQIVYDYLKCLNPDLKSEIKPEKFDLLDILSCPEGCNLGSACDLTVINPSNLECFNKITTDIYSNNQKQRTIDYQEYQRVFDDFNDSLDIEDFLTSYTDRSYKVQIKIPTNEELDRIFYKMKKYTEKDKNINCFSCGNKTCKDLAIAIYNGYNVPTSCFNYGYEKLREQETYIHTVLENVSEAIMVVNEHMIIEYVNKEAVNIFNYERKTYIGKSFFDFLVRFNLPIIKENSNFECKGIHRDGSYRDLKIKCQSFEINNSNKLLMIMRDITYEKEIEVLKKNFVSIISHELRTPLTSIRGSLSLLSSGALGQLPRKVVELLKIANNNTVRLMNLINDMLDLEKIKAGKLEFSYEEVNVSKMVNDALELNKDYATQYLVKFKYNNSSNDSVINADSNRLMQVLNNLMSNAAKNSPANNDIYIDVFKENGFVKIAISNKGEGIPKEVGNKIFHSFYQVNNDVNKKKKGTGLGLNICKYMVEKMNGRINYISVPNKITTFTIAFPEIFVTSATKKVLICEDSKTTATLLSQIFEKTNYFVQVVSNIDEIKRILKNESFDLISLDYTLNDRDGIETLEYLANNERLKNIPIIIISSKPKQPDMMKKYNIIEWIEKGIDNEFLKDFVNEFEPRKQEKQYNILFVEADSEVSNIFMKSFKSDSDRTCVNSVKKAKIFLEKNVYDIIVVSEFLKDGTYKDVVELLNKDTKPEVVLFAETENLNNDDIKYVDKVVLHSQTINKKRLKDLAEREFDYE